MWHLHVPQKPVKIALVINLFMEIVRNLNLGLKHVWALLRFVLAKLSLQQSTFYSDLCYFSRQNRNFITKKAMMKSKYLEFDFGTKLRKLRELKG